MLDLEKGIEAFESENYTEAFRILLPLAETGNAQAQCSVGCMYNFGFGVEANMAEAMKWYRLAACQGHPLAQYNLGVILFMENNFQEAALWYKKAAEQDMPFAQDALGELYASGLGVNKDDALSASWYTKAAERGFIFSCHKLAEMYASGRGVSKDENQAVNWYYRAAQQNYEPSCKALSQAYSEGKLGLSRNLEQAKYWLDKSTADQKSMSLR